MYLFKKVVFNCKKATLLSIKRHEGHITFLERLQLSYHLLYCDPCRKFINQLAKIDQMGKDLNRNLSAQPPFALTDAAKYRIQLEIDRFDN